MNTLGTRRHLTWRTIIKLALLQAAVMFAAFAAIFYLSATTPNPYTAGGTATDVMSSRPHAEGSADALIADHDCWSGKAPADVTIPGHVVLMRDGAVAPVYGGARMVGLALDQIFDGKAHGLTVYAFCR
jgi:hypothetical protein